MIDWEHWAVIILGRLAASLRDHPTNKTLQRMKTSVLRDPAVSAIWKRHARSPAPQYDPAPRRMRHAATGLPGTLTTCTSAIQGFPGYTNTLLHWTAD